MKHRLIFGILLSLLCFSCQRGRPRRKTLPPEFVSLNDEAPGYNTHPPASDILFYYSDTSLLLQGLRRNLAVITLAAPDKDSVICSVINAGQSLLPSLFAQLRGESKSGVVIDLRQDATQPTIREDYLISPDKVSADKSDQLPVIFLWDRGSAARASLFTSQFEQYPGISWSITRHKPGYQNDCFTSSHPSF
jgi:hypothetical protein